MWKYNNLSEVQKELLKINVIDLQGDIDVEMIHYVREALIRLTAQNSPPIQILITSSGGDVSIGLDICDLLKLYKGTTTGLVTGYAKSMAAVILQVCDIRKCTKHANIMIHHISARSISLDAIRSKSKFKRVVSNMEHDQSRLYEILCSRTGKDKKTIIKVCAEDRNMSSEEALKFGLIDEIV